MFNLFYYLFCFFFPSKLQKNTKNRTHTNVRYNKLSTDAASKSKKNRTTTLAVSADDNTEPMLSYSDGDDDDDDKEDDITTFNINESKTDRISFYTNT